MIDQPATLRVVIADDQALVRAGFRMILQTDPGIRVVGEAANGEEAVFAVRRHRPDVVMMDVRMPVLDGLEATRRILAAGGGGGRVIILTTLISTSTCSLPFVRARAASCSRTSRRST